MTNIFASRWERDDDQPSERGEGGFNGEGGGKTRETQWGEGLLFGELTTPQKTRRA